jgi:hypothetical protein
LGAHGSEPQRVCINVEASGKPRQHADARFVVERPNQCEAPFGASNTGRDRDASSASAALESRAIEDAGIERTKAERLASTIVDLIHAEVATTADVAAVSAELTATEAALRADIVALSAELKAWRCWVIFQSAGGTETRRASAAVDWRPPGRSTRSAVRRAALLAARAHAVIRIDERDAPADCAAHA